MILLKLTGTNYSGTSSTTILINIEEIFYIEETAAVTYIQPRSAEEGVYVKESPEYIINEIKKAEEQKK